MDPSNGVHNPNGLFIFAIGAVYPAIASVLSYLASPTGPLPVQRVYEVLFSLVPGGASIAKDRTIIALGVWYMFVTYAVSAGGSGAGQVAGTKGGMDGNYPRKYTSSLTGLPLRLHSAHANLMEVFPSFVFVAATAQALCPTNTHVINLLALHVIAKTLIYYPAYVAGVQPVRSLSHLVSVGSVLAAGWRVLVS